MHLSSCFKLMGAGLSVSCRLEPPSRIDCVIVHIVNRPVNVNVFIDTPQTLLLLMGERIADVPAMGLDGLLL